jgi:hypothetical protein
VPLLSSKKLWKEASGEPPKVALSIDDNLHDFYVGIVRIFKFICMPIAPFRFLIFSFSHFSSLFQRRGVALRRNRPNLNLLSQENNTTYKTTLSRFFVFPPPGFVVTVL